MIRLVHSGDAPVIAAIYNYYVENTVITFEEARVDTEEMEARISNLSGQYPWLVYEQAGTIIGYAYASPWKVRSAYRYAVETSVYLAQDCTGNGVGTKIYSELLHRIKQTDLHIAIGGIALPNAASIALHEKLGFEKIGHFKQVGFKFEQWIDVGYWQLLL